jgi:dynein heavy chain
MVTFFYKRCEETIKDLVPTLIESVLDIYYQVKMDLLPTPSKSHYTFNMRDIYRVC